MKVSVVQVRKQHLTAFQQLAAHEADRRLVLYLRRRFPETLAASSEVELLSKVQETRTTAARYGILKQADVATFLDLAVMYGDTFHRDEWAAEILDLDLKSMHGPDKMALLRYRVSESGVEL